LSPGESRSRFWDLENSFCWYDFSVECDADASFQQRLAGHVETGRHSVSDPALGLAAV
jgi:phospholipase C